MVYLDIKIMILDSIVISAYISVALNNAENAFTTLKERQDHNHLDFVLINKFKIAILRKPEKRHLKQSYIGCCGSN